ncbi:MAG: hypothetical protein ACRDKI_10835 [Solirubrobacterales bacterium]
MNDSYTKMPINEMEAIWAGGFKRARAALGVTAFGMSVSDLPPDFNHVPLHVHTFDGQEEAYYALRGSGWLEVNGERLELTQETVVRVGPTASRRPIAGPDGIRLLTIGGTPGKAYEPFGNSVAGAPEPRVVDLPGVKAAHDHESSDDFAVLALEEMNPLSGRLEGVKVYPVRSSLGISSFGINAFDLEPAPEADYGSNHPTHAEEDQEEVYIPISGAGEILIGEERHELPPGEMVRVAPGVTRKLIPAEGGMRVLVIGAPIGAALENARF